jgi:hypothetical protein
MANMKIICPYTHGGSASPETWEITPIQKAGEYFLVCHNCPQNFQETIQIGREMYNKAVLFTEHDVGEYLKTAYQHHLSKQRKN